MFIGKERKKLASGREHTYISLAHNVWQTVGEGDERKGRTKPVIMARLGALEDLDVQTLTSAYPKLQ